MFSTNRTTATLAHVNFYGENHGDDKATGIALKMVMNLSHGVLDMFRPKLAETFFRLDTKEIEVRFPEIAEITWGRELIGAKVAIGYEDLFDSDPIELDGVVVDHFRFALKNGGSVEVTLRIKCKPSSATVAKLYDWMMKDVLLTVEPPKASEQLAAAAADDLVSRAEIGSIKYRNDATGETWTGRGMAPKWIEGKDRAQFKVGASA